MILLGYTFKDSSLAEQALTHPSYRHFYHLKEDYERLEFLGDSVVGLAVSELLYRKYPDTSDGELSHMCAYLVSQKVLAQIAKENNLDQLIKIDLGEERSGGRTNKHNLENVLEAVLAAIFLDSSYEIVLKIIASLWEQHLILDVNIKSPKSSLQEWSQKHFKSAPQYKLLNKQGELHAPIFTIEVQITNLKSFTGIGNTKKEAEIEAALKALDYLKTQGMYDNK